MKNKIIVREPQPFHTPVDRRRFFKSMLIASAGFTLPGYLAEALTIAPSVTQGPYYPTPATMPLAKEDLRRDLSRSGESASADARQVKDALVQARKLLGLRP